MAAARAMWAGIAAPVVFVSVFVVEGWLRVGYDSRSMYISALALGPRGWVQILNFLIFGVLLLVFVRGIAGDGSWRVGRALLMAIALGLLVIGPFVMDPVGTSRSMRSVHGMVHGSVSRIVLVLMPASCFEFGRMFRRAAGWGWLGWFSLAAGTITAIAVVVLGVATSVGSMLNVFGPWLGAIQRVAVVSFMVWLFGFAVRLRKAGI